MFILIAPTVVPSVRLLGVFANLDSVMNFIKQDFKTWENVQLSQVLTFDLEVNGGPWPETVDPHGTLFHRLLDVKVSMRYRRTKVPLYLRHRHGVQCCAALMIAAVIGMDQAFLFDYTLLEYL